MTSNDSLGKTDTNNSSLQETHEGNQRQLQMYIQKMRSLPPGPAHVDAAYDVFVKIKDKCADLGRAILQEGPRYVDMMRRDSSLEPASPGAVNDQRSSFSGRSLGEAMSGGRGHVSETGLSTVKEWKACVETLTDSFRTSLADTYKHYERDATPEMIESLFTSRRFRKEAVNRMRNASVTRVLSADPQFVSYSTCV